MVTLIKERTLMGTQKGVTLGGDPNERGDQISSLMKGGLMGTLMKEGPDRDPNEGGASDGDPGVRWDFDSDPKKRGDSWGP